MAKRALLPKGLVAALLEMVPHVAARAEQSLAAEIPAFAAGARPGERTVGVSQGIEVALTGLLRLTGQPSTTRDTSPDTATLDAAYAFGQFEAQRGRSVEALLAAYRVGARVAWRDFSAEVLRRNVAAGTIAQVAELVFAYIDHLSAASMAGHTDQLATRDRGRQHSLERLAKQLLHAAPVRELELLADIAEWNPPMSLIAALVPAAQVRPALQHLDHSTLLATADIAPGAPEQWVVLLIPEPQQGRDAIVRALRNSHALVGPSRSWTEVHTSYRRALRVLELAVGSSTSVIDTDQHLVELIVGADPDALRDLRARALSRFTTLKPATAQRLVETLRSWLIHQGRRDEVAAELNVHAQTVRYRMGQIRELVGEQLDDPRQVVELFLAVVTFPDHPPV